MPSIVNVAMGLAGALVFWGLLGFAVSRRLMPGVLALPAAPALGWAIHNTLALPLYGAIGFSSTTVAAVSLVALIGAVVSLAAPATADRDSGLRLPLWAYGLAALAAFLPT